MSGRNELRARPNRRTVCERACGNCGALFLPPQESRRFCSVRCGYIGRSNERRRSTLSHLLEKTKFGPVSECWPWTGTRNAGGYGILKQTAKAPARYVHRIVHQMTHGGGKSCGPVVRHDCDNPWCVNPSHLRCGTHADNMHDAKTRGRMRSGESHRCCKLTDKQIRSARQAHLEQGIRVGVLARQFRVSDGYMSDVLSFKVRPSA